MKSMDLTVGDAMYLYTICPILPDSSDLLPYKESLFLWLYIEPPRHAWRRPAIQQLRTFPGMPYIPGIVMAATLMNPSIEDLYCIVRQSPNTGIWTTGRCNAIPAICL
jgi:hypothetical protein